MHRPKMDGSRKGRESGQTEAAGMPHWQGGLMDIFVNTAGMSNPSAVKFWAEETVWLWGLRTGLDLTYAGPTSATVPTAGNTLIMMPTTGDWAAQGWTETSASGYTLDSNGGQLIMLNPHIPIDTGHNELLIHEIGHALGYLAPYPHLSSHSPDADDIMSAVVNHGNFPVSIADALGVIEFSKLPSVDTPDLTSAYMRWDGDLFVTDVLYDGGRYQAQLDARGPTDLGVGAGIKNTWLLHSFTLNEEATGTAATYVNSAGTTAFIHSIQSAGQDYINASLSIVGVGSEIYLQLDSITLV